MTKKEFSEIIGRTQLSWLLDMQYRKGNITATALEIYYDEILQIVREAEKQREQKIKRFLKRQSIAPDLK